MVQRLPEQQLRGSGHGRWTSWDVRDGLIGRVTGLSTY